MKTALQVLLWVIALPGVGSLVLLAATRSGEAKNRRRETFAKAYAACQAYREFPYVVRRRGRNDPEAERLRISTELRAVQQDLAFYLGWMATESKPVAEAYQQLVAVLREVAGGEIRAAWQSAPPEADEQMNIAMDLSEMRGAEDTYLAAVTRHLSFMRWRAAWWALRHSRLDAKPTVDTVAEGVHEGLSE